MPHFARVVAHHPDHAPTTATDLDVVARLAASVAEAQRQTTSAWVRMRYQNGVLTAVVGDHGRGGAVLGSGGGLQGIRRRLGAFDGTLHLSSPPAGPTVVTMELP